ncbi:MAG: pyridoxamine 5'-phosphate oxidase [Salinisphaeraceae bacterium]|nr:pyridoxamine 5'-phosphate oxidase [Salinisphaeraceae bacterium]
MTQRKTDSPDSQPIPGWITRLDRRDLEADRLPRDPIQLFSNWFDQALDAGLLEPTAMTLATATPDGQPSARVVLLKGFDASGFRFFTNYESRKGRELADNAHAALVFWWDRLERQVRIRGTVEKLDPQASTEYYDSRPRGSRIGAHASPQSRPIESREALEARVKAIEARFGDGDIPRPDQWGGYRVVPDEVEFWQGRESRLHDRIVFQRTDDGWSTTRLAP